MKTCWRKSNRKGGAGFTLIEILFALLVLTLLITGGASMLFYSGETVMEQRNKRAAVAAANRRMELLRYTGRFGKRYLPADGRALRRFHSIQQGIFAEMSGSRREKGLRQRSMLVHEELLGVDNS